MTSQTNQRRSQSWDVAGYGISGTLGPAVVAAIAAIIGPLAATLMLAAAIGAGTVLALPKQAPLADAFEVPSPVRTLETIWESEPLQRTRGLECSRPGVSLPLRVVGVTVTFDVGSLRLLRPMCCYVARLVPAGCSE